MGEAPERRLKDAQGHEWPVTGYWCSVCGMPLHPMLRDAGVHLNCEADPTRTRPRTPREGEKTARPSPTPDPTAPTKGTPP